MLGQIAKFGRRINGNLFYQVTQCNVRSVSDCVCNIQHRTLEIGKNIPQYSLAITHKNNLLLVALLIKWNKQQYQSMATHIGWGFKLAVKICKCYKVQKGMRQW